MYQHESLQVKSVPAHPHFSQRGLFDRRLFSGLLGTVISRAFKTVHQQKGDRPFSKEVAYCSVLADRIQGGKPSGWTRMYAGLWRRSKSCVHQWVKRYREDADISCFEDQLRRTDAWVERYAGHIPTEVYERKVDGLVDEVANWMLRTMDEKSQRRRWRGVMARLVKKIWTVSKDLFLLLTGALSQEKREYPERRVFEITLRGVREIDAMIARWVRSPELLRAGPRYRLVRKLNGQPLYAFTDKGRKAYYAAKAHSEATRGGYRKPEPEPAKQPPPPTAPEDSPFGTLTAEIARAMGGSSREDRAPKRNSGTHLEPSKGPEAGEQRSGHTTGRARVVASQEKDDRSQKEVAGADVMTEAEARSALRIMPPAFEMAEVPGGWVVRRRVAVSA
jgi:hypothetical protein